MSGLKRIQLCDQEDLWKVLREQNEFYNFEQCNHTLLLHVCLLL